LCFSYGYPGLFLKIVMIVLLYHDLGHLLDQYRRLSNKYGMGVWCWNKYTYLYGLPLAERRCDRPRVSWTFCQCIQPTDLGVVGGNVVLESLHMTCSLQVEWRMDGICTHVYCKHLTNLRLGLMRSPGINELLFVVKHWEGSN
jgi:hypothetical protein